MLGQAIDCTRDFKFSYLGMQTLYDRYFLHDDDIRYELPQTLFMRVAMGLALQEDDINARAIEFYNLLSSFDFMSSTPTLFNSGTLRAQLSSCFLTTSSDDIDNIFDAFKRGDKHGQQGLGLGLAIASEAAQFLGANLTVESQLRIGTTFRLTLPRSSALNENPVQDFAAGV